MKGLTPKLFWQHKREILETSRAELSRLISSLVSRKHSRNDENPPSPIIRVDGSILICSISDLLSCDFMRTRDPMNTVFLLLTSRDTEQGSVLPAFPDEMTVLQVPVTEGKKGQIHFLEEVLPHSMDYIRRQLSCRKRVCIACNTGQDVSVGVALSALQYFFDDEGKYITAGAPVTPRKQICYSSSNVLPTPLADKKSIRTRLEWIISSRPLVNPSRTTLKRVNEFFLSSASLRNSLKN